jgi:hypothetical protein
MPKEAFGGDGDEGPDEEKKKLALDKFGLSPDYNIRDLFWKIMGSYAAAKKPGLELGKLEHDRFALMRVAVSVLSNPEGENFGLPPRFTSTYSIMMMLDGGWGDVLAEFLELALDSKLRIRSYTASSLKKLIGQEKYRDGVFGLLGSMLRKNQSAPAALEYISEINEPDLAKSLKKELIIFARGDIGKNQQNAIRAISAIKDEPDVIKSFIVLLSHWDKEARLAAAKALVGVESDEAKEAAAKKAETESDEEIRKILKGIRK